MNVLFQALSYFKTPEANNNELILESVDKTKVLEDRKQCIGSKVDVFYGKDPFLVSMGKGQYLFDENGRQFLDCISNVQHVGHCNPKVASRVYEQMLTTNCNIRFLSNKLTDAAKAILATLPSELDTVLFVNSGSEANDLALRLARDYTKNTDVVCMDHAYHGHLISTMQISPYKFDHGSSIPKPEWVHVTATPDVYRGKYRLNDLDLSNEEKLVEMGTMYANDLRKMVESEVKSQGRTVSAYIAEALQSCGGQIIPPKGYMSKVAKIIRSNGGVMIIDEVQTGFGRVGQKFWAHQLQDDTFVPDILTMGKPMGNGFPVAAVVTRKEIADCLGGEVGYFNTFGGNPVSCSAVLAVMEVLKEENLLRHSEEMGTHFEEQLGKLKEKHQCIGDIRGVGMFWGLDLVLHRESRLPATELAVDLCFKLREEYGVLLNADGPHTNILKFKPPLCFNKDDLEFAVSSLDKALYEMGY
ncbi:unnamed protein product [Bursaphelenchus xylophilus]|uniref:(pine wood nematode) hypothetical protein n=1 Tax=Bursaphelenchus xylophilus TaxID=6326 RepID=A0A1I7RH82_BURXY|nr:unnamed protein product [Bursaphelenchus xylophilus]CAG9115941.1 unnamed protein product [Bursaphelenchus xylophilus]